MRKKKESCCGKKHNMHAHSGKSAQHHIGASQQPAERSGLSNMPIPENGSGLFDPINHPRHYTQHPSGIECIQITEHMSFNLGNAIKYIWRADLKGDAMEDLRKAKWYIERELQRRGKL